MDCIDGPKFDLVHVIDVDSLWFYLYSHGNT